VNIMGGTISWVNIATRKDINTDAYGFRKHSLDKFIVPAGKDQLKLL